MSIDFWKALELEGFQELVYTYDVWGDKVENISLDASLPTRKMSQSLSDAMEKVVRGSCNLDKISMTFNVVERKIDGQ